MTREQQLELQRNQLVRRVEELEEALRSWYDHGSPAHYEHNLYRALSILWNKTAVLLGLMPNSEVDHVCGLSGYDPMRDQCPACELRQLLNHPSGEGTTTKE